jgi:hypothetical protein
MMPSGMLRATTKLVDNLVRINLIWSADVPCATPGFSSDEQHALNLHGVRATSGQDFCLLVPTADSHHGIAEG